MAVLANSFVGYQLGAAPPQEPISGRFAGWPILEALFLGGLWGIALGAILFAIALLTDRSCCAGPSGPGSSAAPSCCSSAR